VHLAARLSAVYPQILASAYLILCCIVLMQCLALHVLCNYVCRAAGTPYIRQQVPQDAYGPTGSAMAVSSREQQQGRRKQTIATEQQA
jgi:hypothetical protein